MNQLILNDSKEIWAGLSRLKCNPRRSTLCIVRALCLLDIVMCRTGLNLELVCVVYRVSLSVCVCCLAIRFFQPSSLSSCLWAVLLLLRRCIHVQQQRCWEKEKKRKFSTSFLLPSSRYGRQPNTQGGPASHLQSAVVPLVNF